MRPATTHATVSAIVARSLPLEVPDGTVTLERGEDGRYQLVEHLAGPGQRAGVYPRGADGRKLPTGHVLSTDEAERCVRTLLGLEKPRQRRWDGARANV